MAKHIHKCNSCKIYTVEDTCVKCGKKTIQPKPAKFSLDDKYAHLRREAKQKELKKEGLY
jgi:H/ACA ribonucleoprotein complex subunit 3